MVVDTWQDRPSSATELRPAESRSGDTLRPGVQRTAFDGRAQFTTLALYDAKGPRTIMLDAQGAAMMAWAKPAIMAMLLAYLGLALWMPILFGLPFLLAQKSVRESLRLRIAAGIDRLAARHAGGGRQ